MDGGSKSAEQHAWLERPQPIIKAVSNHRHLYNCCSRLALCCLPATSICSQFVVEQQDKKAADKLDSAASIRITMFVLSAVCLLKRMLCTTKDDPSSQ